MNYDFCMTKYSRKKYKSRGHLRFRDKIWESFQGRNCVYCETQLHRRSYPSGREESMCSFLRRKSCGFEFDKNGNKKMSKCMLEAFLIGKNNGNCKGILPKCSDCGKKISYKKGENNNWIAHERCGRCSKKFLRENGKFKERALKNLVRYQWVKGQKSTGVPFKKGMTSCNKGKHLSKKTKVLLSVAAKKRWEEGIYKRERSERIVKECIVCKKKMILTPYLARVRKTCSLSCASKKRFLVIK